MHNLPTGAGTEDFVVAMMAQQMNGGGGGYGSPGSSILSKRT